MQIQTITIDKQSNFAQSLARLPKAEANTNGVKH
jgi:hypothetical protein